MKYFFLSMQCPHTQRFINIGDFKQLDDAVRYADNVPYYTRIKECTEDYSSVIIEGNLFGMYNEFKLALGN